jgi:hypothetical protein
MRIRIFRIQIHNVESYGLRFLGSQTNVIHQLKKLIEGGLGEPCPTTGSHGIPNSLSKISSLCSFSLDSLINVQCQPERALKISNLLG